MMQTAGESVEGVAISTLADGTGVMVLESGVAKPYIYLGLDLDGHARLIRYKLFGNARRMATTKEQLDYDGVELDTWLSNTFITYLTHHVQNALADTSLTYACNNWAQNKTIQRKVFCVSMSETGQISGEGGKNFRSAFEAYTGVSGNKSLVAQNESGVAKPWWYCSQQNGSYYRVQYTDGTLNGWPATSTTAVWVRPCLSVLASAIVTEQSGVYTLWGV